MSFLNDDKKGIPWKTLINGGVVGAVEAVLTYPTEYVKTHLQLQSKVNPEYTGIWSCVKGTVKQHGVLGLYRGLTPLLIGSIPKQGIRWFAYDTISGQLKEDGKLSSSRRSMAGFGAGCAEAIFAVVPMETIKTKIIDDKKSANPQFRGTFDAMKKIVKTQGMGGLYKGVAATTTKQGLNQAVRFPVQNFLLNVMTGGDKSKQSSTLYNGLAGCGAGAISVLVTQPADVVKTRMQGVNASSKGMFSVAADILRTEGPMFFYAGTGPRILRVSFDVGATFAIFPVIQKLMNQYVWQE